MSDFQYRLSGVVHGDAAGHLLSRVPKEVLAGVANGELAGLIGD